MVKTTLAIHLATDPAGRESVLVADIDPQGSTLDWTVLRPAEVREPSSQVENHPPPPPPPELPREPERSSVHQLCTGE